MKSDPHRKSAGKKNITCTTVLCFTIICAHKLAPKIATARSTTKTNESYIMTDGESASLSWYEAPIWGLRTDLYYCQTVAGLLMWGVVSDERTDLSFTIAAGPLQLSHSWARVPWDSRPYFTIASCGSLGYDGGM
jgi:hypothetical protein